jgi:hypothetical protein
MCCGKLAAVDRPPVVLIRDALILRQIQVPQINIEEWVRGILHSPVMWVDIISRRNKRDFVG